MLPSVQRLVLAAALACAAACGSDSPVDPGPPGPAPNPHRIVLTAGGISPGELTVPPGSRVLFVNNDARRHDITSDPHPEHDDCTALNQIGALQPGQSRETGNLVLPGVCAFHDDDSPGSATFRGRIVVQ